VRYFNEACFLACLLSTLLFKDTFAQESLRITPTVKLIEEIEPCVVTLFAKTGEGSFGIGSGSFIHSDGYILTNYHVVQSFDGFVVLPSGDVAEYQYIGGVPERDIAIVKAKLPEPAKVLPLGRSHDLRNGEPIISAGNPGGRGMVFSSGIVSSKGIMTDANNVLVMSQFRGSIRDLAIQFDAASNRGNSGGPLVNVEGKQIGVVAAKNFEEENINFAIPIDRVRSILSGALAAEPTRNIGTGITVDYLTDSAIVLEVAKGSPAETVGLRSGDVLLAWNDKPIVTGIDWDLMLLSSKAGDKIELTWSRDSLTHKSSLQLEHYRTAWPSSSLDMKPTDLESGLNYRLYHLVAPILMPDFSAIPVVREGVVEDLSLSKANSGRDEDFGLVYDGYIHIAKPGLFRLTVMSDDGSKVYLNNRLFIDHDGNHPAYRRGRIERFEAGYHQIRIAYYEGRGDMALGLELDEFDKNRPIAVPVQFSRSGKKPE